MLDPGRDDKRNTPSGSAASDQFSAPKRFFSGGCQVRDRSQGLAARETLVSAAESVRQVLL